MDSHHRTNTQPARDLLADVVLRNRARLFSTPPADPRRRHTDLQLDPTGAAERADYLLHSLHVALSAQRTLWSSFELLRTAVFNEVGHELSDAALSYIGQLASSGTVDLVSHEHVAELLAIKDPAPGHGEAV